MHARGSGAIAPDGSPVEFYKRLGPPQALEAIVAALPGGASVLDLGCGVGRFADPLALRGHSVVAVDVEPAMLAEVRHAETVRADITTLDLARRFDAVLLLSHLVNHGDAGVARALLATCRRHVAAGGIVVVEHLDAAWAATAADGVTLDSGGVRIALRDVRRDGDVFAATTVYETGGHTWEQPFENRVLDDRGLDALLAGAGLRRARRLERTLLVAEPAGAGAGG